MIRGERGYETYHTHTRAHPLRFHVCISQVALALPFFSAAYMRHRHWMSVAAAGICRLKCFCRCFCCTLSAKPEPRMPAGRAKNEMANRAKQEAMMRPSHVCGTTSP